MYIISAIIGLFFVFLDFKKKSPIFMSLAITFIFEMIILYKYPTDYKLQLITLLSFYIVFYFMIKSCYKIEEKEKQKEKQLLNYIDKNALVTRDIGKKFSLDGIGQIKFNNELWQAKSLDDSEIKSGSKVKIVSRENKIFNVEVIK